MGADYHAVAVLGCRLRRRDLRATARTRGCACAAEPPAGANYCPGCGRRAWVIGGPDNEDILDLPVIVAAQAKGLAVEFADDSVFVGAVAATGSSNGGESEALAPGDHSAVEAALRSLPFWDPAAFGLWAVLRCSC